MTGTRDGHLRGAAPHNRPGAHSGQFPLFLVTQEGDLDRTDERLRGAHMKLVDTNLTGAEQSMLNESIGG